MTAAADHRSLAEVVLACPYDTRAWLPALLIGGLLAWRAEASGEGGFESSLRSHFPKKIAIFALQDGPCELPEGCWSRDPDGFLRIPGVVVGEIVRKVRGLYPNLYPLTVFSNQRFTQHGFWSVKVTGRPP